MMMIDKYQEAMLGMNINQQVKYYIINKTNNNPIGILFKEILL
jgi:hypothetical protein